MTTHSLRSLLLATMLGTIGAGCVPATAVDGAIDDTAQAAAPLTAFQDIRLSPGAPLASLRIQCERERNCQYTVRLALHPGDEENDILDWFADDATRDRTTARVDVLSLEGKYCANKKHETVTELPNTSPRAYCVRNGTEIVESSETFTLGTKFEETRQEERVLAIGMPTIVSGKLDGRLSRTIVVTKLGYDAGLPQNLGYTLSADFND